MVGELDAGNPHVQFDEGALETCDNATRLCPTLPKPPFSYPLQSLNSHLLMDVVAAVVHAERTVAQRPSEDRTAVS